jgi:hypothetical protein
MGIIVLHCNNDLANPTLIGWKPRPKHKCHIEQKPRKPDLSINPRFTGEHTRPGVSNERI